MLKLCLEFTSFYQRCHFLIHCNFTRVYMGTHTGSLVLLPAFLLTTLGNYVEFNSLNILVSTPIKPGFKSNVREIYEHE